MTLNKKLYKIFRFSWFLISDVIWGGLKFYFNSSRELWQEFNKKDK